MSGWHSKSVRREPPNRQNYTYMDVDVDGGTVRRPRYACARCGGQHSEQQTKFVVESDRLKTAVTTRFGSLYYHAAGSAYDWHTRTWPYCGECYDDLATAFFDHHPAIRPASSNGERYKQASCGCCGERKPVTDLTPYVLKPTKAVHQQGGPGMTAASYPRIRGKAVRGLCGDCNARFKDEWREQFGDDQ